MTLSKLKLRLYGDPCLRKKSIPVKEITSGERMLIGAMLETMREHKGVGLAAPQVGINQRIFVADIGEGPVAVINPKVMKKSGSAVLEEGCLSIPGVTVKVKRPEKIWVQFRDENNQPAEKNYDGLMARVFQHETDHLDGRLIVDYAGLRGKRKLKEKLEEIRQAMR